VVRFLPSTDAVGTMSALTFRVADRTGSR